MSSSSTVVEHVVLFKVKPETPSDKVMAMMNGIHELRSLDGVLDLTLTPVLHLFPSLTPLTAGFTHVLHGRYKDKASLSAYSVSAAHVNVIEKRVKPIIDDLLALDWEATPSPPMHEDFAVIRIVLFKLKERVMEEDLQALLGILNSYSSISPCVGQVSAGVNFAPGRAQGFNYGYLAQLKSVKDLEYLVGNAEHRALMETTVNPHVESFIQVDAFKQIEAASARI